jgi:hypothetical protein
MTIANFALRTRNVSFGASRRGVHRHSGLLPEDRHGLLRARGACRAMTTPRRQRAPPGLALNRRQ